MKGCTAFSGALYCLVDHPTDPSAATWTLLPGKLNTPRYGHASITLFEGRMWVADVDNDGRMLFSVKVFNIFASTRKDSVPFTMWQNCGCGHFSQIIHIIFYFNIN
jgi:hypothetical protein